jgi:plastocyanin
VTVPVAVTAFHVLGGLLAVWALVLAYLGITRREFPGSGGHERIVGAISVTLALAAISSAIIVAALEDEEEGKSEAAPASKIETGAGQSLKLSADPSGKLAFDKSSLQAKSGPLVIAMTNPSQLQHDVSIEGPGAEKEGKVVGKGGVSTVSAEVKPGKYTYYCSVPGHRDGGMEGTLTVK